MSIFAPERRKEQIKIKLAEILRREINNPSISGVTITDVQIDKKIQKLVILFSSIDDDPDLIEAELNKAGGFIHKKLFKSLGTRNLPSLRFKHDKGFEHSSKIDSILSRIKQNQ